MAEGWSDLRRDLRTNNLLLISATSPLGQQKWLISHSQWNGDDNTPWCSRLPSEPLRNSKHIARCWSVV